MQKVQLNNGIEMPILGFGVFQIPDEKECERCVVDAIEVGYRSIDTAASYFNEEAVGNAIKSSGIAREDLFITTKLWIQRDGFEGTLKAFDKSLKKLKLDYLDLYLIHQPYGDVYGEWKALEKLYKEGLIRAIGVSNFKPDKLMDLMMFGAEIIPAVNQIEFHPFCQQQENLAFLKQKGIQTESWGPFAEGRNNMFQNELLTNIASKYQKSVAQVILRFIIQSGVVVIPKTTSKSRMVDNFSIFDFALNESDLNEIKSLDLNTSQFFDHRDVNMIQWMADRDFKI